MKRVNEIASLISEPFETLIDIGSDHGFVGIKLLQDEKVKSVWNVDLSITSLNSSKNFYQKANLLDKSLFIHSDGFQKLQEIPKKSLLVLAGLGTTKILSIVSTNNLEDIKTIIFLPHTCAIDIRRWAQKNKWNIVDERYFVEKDIVYLIFKLEKPTDKNSFCVLSDKDIFLGESKFILKNLDLWKIYCTNLQNKISLKPHEYRQSWEDVFLKLWFNFSLVKI